MIYPENWNMVLQVPWNVMEKKCGDLYSKHRNVRKKEHHVTEPFCNGQSVFKELGVTEEKWLTRCTAASSATQIHWTGLLILKFYILHLRSYPSPPHRKIFYALPHKIFYVLVNPPSLVSRISKFDTKLSTPMSRVPSLKSFYEDNETM